MAPSSKRIDSTAVALFLGRLLRRSVLDDAEQEAVRDLPFEPAEYRPRQDIVALGQMTDHACLVAEGLIGRFAETSGGDRQIVAFHLPGDMADLHSVVAPHAVSPLQALTGAIILRVPHTALRACATRWPALAHAFWRDGIVDAAIVAQAVVNLGMRDAAERMAHLLCEMGLRYEAIGRGTRTRYEFPATQASIGEALGLTPIHVNRTLRVLREEGLVTMSSRRVAIQDWDRLVARAEFDPLYLQFERVDFHGPADRTVRGH